LFGVCAVCVRGQLAHGDDVVVDVATVVDAADAGGGVVC